VHRVPSYPASFDFLLFGHFWAAPHALPVEHDSFPGSGVDDAGRVEAGAVVTGTGTVTVEQAATGEGLVTGAAMRPGQSRPVGAAAVAGRPCLLRGGVCDGFS